MVKKHLIFVIFLSLILSGCSTEQFTTDNKNPANEIILTMYSEDLKKEDEAFSSPVAKAITKATGVKLDIQHPVEGVAKKIELMVASDDYPDLIMVKDTYKMVEAGAYIDLTNLINEHAPNLRIIYEDYFNRLKFSAENSAIYVLPTRPVNQRKWEPTMSFALQHAVVKELGYPIIETLDDFEQAIRQYKEKFPLINGEPSLGISMVIDDWRWKISLGNAAGFATGAPDDGNWFINPNTLEAKYRFLRTEEKAYYKWLNQMYHEGLVDPDSFVQNYDAYLAKIASGRVLGLIDAKWQYDYAQNQLRAKGMEERMYGQYPVQVDASTKAADFRDVGYIAGYGIGISRDCKNPVEAIKFLDFMASHEGHVLRMWGIEDVNFKYDENGKRFIPDDEMEKRLNDEAYSEETGVGVYTYPYPIWGDGKKDKQGNFYNPENEEDVKKQYSDDERSALKAYGVENWSDLYPSAEELPVSVWGEAWDIQIPINSPIRSQLNACDAIIKQGLIQVTISQPEDFDQLWDDLMNELDKAGVHQMGKLFTQLVKERVSLWQQQ
ncbi:MULTISPECIES: ABC transporter substrate-binding protein [unclassified Fusibacter]|uniref:ABC transporter substrate-binding protein n=1 Tax=unclassified Fusibacter TaxID=2624464 RepID=UPI001010DE10|nr:MULTISPECIES: ABC transporter substrate-binding protein [unclassified Fusibacter]MCK8061668.1 ABC transporter substrate-binding protein [Fusibacter sp. A2]NPE23852.1 extracellular solute-binding protein [Fusibacter sp. A1]RXV58567.1 extracellular solute-binding protein [Fusibacter sp. A1]